MANISLAPEAEKVSTFKTLSVLFKWRVVSLLLFSSVGGAFLAAEGWPGWANTGLVLLTGGLAASGSGALNQWWEKDKDTLMERTKLRPLANDTLSWAKWVPLVASLMIILPVALVYPFNAPLAFFLLLGAVIYVGIYTIWLKPRTLTNIVIGGAAGSAAVLSGSAAVGNWADPGAIVLALLIFLWTPAHFWSLAIMYREDYMRGDVPMLPTKTTPRAAGWWVMLHTIATAIAALMLWGHPNLGWIYLVPVAIATVDLVRRNINLINDPVREKALALFLSSNIYLAIIVLAACIDVVIG